MKRRRETSGGQAIVLVTLSLLAMCGMLGLAVDLGWSFFVQKEARAAADSAALAAVQEGQYRLNGDTFGFTCAGSPSVYCQTTPVDCTVGALTGGASSNLWNGCKFAEKNGFTSGGLTGRQRVTIQSNEASDLNPPPTAPDVKDVVYWVTVRTTQTIPQLFSAVGGHTEGVVSAVATAGIISVIIPGSFIALNQAGECITRPTGKAAFDYDCGVDVDLSGGSGSQNCTAADGSQTAPIATLCGGSGIILSSNCHGDSSQAGCGTSGNNNNACANGGNYAGCTSGSTKVWSITTQIQGDANTKGWVDDSGCTTPGGSGTCTDWTPKPVNTDNQEMFKDPKWKQAQPPIAADNTMATCAIPGGTITGSGDPANPLVLGPYQYFASTSAVNLTPTGDPIVLNGAVKFAANGACSNNYSSNTAGASGAASPLDSNFPAYLFYGGMQITNNNVNFGRGQYVMVGTSSPTGASFTLGTNGSPTVTGDQFGTQFITTAPSYNGDPGYPGLATQMAASSLTTLRTGGVPLYQGYTDIKGGNSSNVTLWGLNRDNLLGLQPTVENLGNYSGDLFWQDRRNSTVEYSQTDGTIVSRPCYPNGCSTIAAGSILDRNRVTFSSPKFLYESSANLNLHGAIYQPRGAWLQLGGNPNTHARIQIVTGMILDQGGGQLDLQPTDAPLIKYITALIQ